MSLDHKHPVVIPRAEKERRVAPTKIVAVLEMVMAMSRRLTQHKDEGRTQTHQYITVALRRLLPTLMLLVTVSTDGRGLVRRETRHPWIQPPRLVEGIMATP